MVVNLVLDVTPPTLPFVSKVKKMPNHNPIAPERRTVTVTMSPITHGEVRRRFFNEGSDDPVSHTREFFSRGRVNFTVATDTHIIEKVFILERAFE